MLLPVLSWPVGRVVCVVFDSCEMGLRKSFDLHRLNSVGSNHTGRALRAHASYLFRVGGVQAFSSLGNRTSLQQALQAGTLMEGPAQAVHVVEVEVEQDGQRQPITMAISPRSSTQHLAAPSIPPQSAAAAAACSSGEPPTDRVRPRGLASLSSAASQFLSRSARRVSATGRRNGGRVSLRKASVESTTAEQESTDKGEPSSPDSAPGVCGDYGQGFDDHMPPAPKAKVKASWKFKRQKTHYWCAC